MNQSVNTIIKNIGALLGSQVVTWVLTLALTIFLPRYLGPSGVGELRFAFSIWAILGVLIAFGMEVLIVKEIARHPEKTPVLIGTSFILRSILFGLSCGIVALYLWFLHAPVRTVALMYILGVSALVGQLGGVGDAALRGLEIMEGVSLANVASKAINTALGIAVLILGYGVYGIAFVGIIAGLSGLVIQIVFLKRRSGYSPVLRRGPGRAILRASAPYMMTGLAMVLYGQVDTLVIHTLVDTAVLGWYSVAIQLSGTLLFLPVILSTAVFPSMTRSHISDPAAMSRLIGKSFDLMLLVAVPIGFGIMVISNPLVTLIFGSAFAPAGPVLAVMGIVVILLFQNIVLGQFLISIDRQNFWTVITIVAIAVTVLLDLWLVPWCQQRYGNGAIGGALSYVLTEAGIMVAAIAYTPRGILSLANVWTAARVLAAGFVMVCACWWVREMFIAIPVVVGAATYLGMIVVLRVVPAEAVRFASAMAHHALGRLRGHVAEPIGSEGG